MSLRSRSLSKSFPPPKRALPNPKYRNVQPTVDTGASVSNYMRRLAELGQYYKFRKDEPFKRIKVTTFVKLVLQVLDLEDSIRDRDFLETSRSVDLPRIDENDVDDNTFTLPALVERDSKASYASRQNGTESVNTHATLQSVIAGLGEVDLKKGRTSLLSPVHTSRRMIRNTNAPSEPWWELLRSETAEARESSRQSQISNELKAASAPYLLLDVREREDFDAGHLRTAVWYPITMVTRSVNNELPAMRALRNVSGVLIVVYDADESLAPQVASTLVQRGYDNLFMLSGGLRVAKKLFPDGLVVTDESEFDWQAAQKLRVALGSLALSQSRSIESTSILSSRNSSRASLFTTSSSLSLPASSRSSRLSTKSYTARSYLK